LETLKTLDNSKARAYLELGAISRPTTVARKGTVGGFDVRVDAGFKAMGGKARRRALCNGEVWMPMGRPTRCGA